MHSVRDIHYYCSSLTKAEHLLTDATLFNLLVHCLKFWTDKFIFAYHGHLKSQKCGIGSYKLPSIICRKQNHLELLFKLWDGIHCLLKKRKMIHQSWSLNIYIISIYMWLSLNIYKISLYVVILVSDFFLNWICLSVYDLNRQYYSTEYVLVNKNLYSSPRQHNSRCWSCNKDFIFIVSIQILWRNNSSSI